jgi:hypothetical protein
MKCAGMSRTKFTCRGGEDFSSSSEAVLDVASPDAAVLVAAEAIVVAMISAVAIAVVAIAVVAIAAVAIAVAVACSLVVAVAYSLVAAAACSLVAAAAYSLVAAAAYSLVAAATIGPSGHLDVRRLPDGSAEGIKDGPEPPPIIAGAVPELALAPRAESALPRREM